MVHKYTIDKTDIHDLLTEKEIPLALSFGKARAFKVEIVGKLTNGDMIKALFPDATFHDDTFGYGYVYSDGVRCDESYMMTYSKEWWNTPYNTESEE